MNDLAKQFDRQIRNLRIRLGLDAVCWIGTALVLGLWLDWHIAAALVGATGSIYLRLAGIKYFQLVKKIRLSQQIATTIIDHIEHK